MKTPHTLSLLLITAALGFLPLAQGSPESRTADDVREAFMRERRAMMAEIEALREQYGDADAEAWREAHRAWRLENREQVERIRELAEEMGRASSPPERPQISLEDYKQRLPENLSPAQRELMIERFKMREARIKAGLDDPALSLEERHARREAFSSSEQNRRARIDSLAQQVAAESAAQPRPEPPSAEGWEPPETLPEAMREYMRERRKLRRAEWEYQQTLSRLSPEQQAVALREFRHQQHQNLEPLREAAHNALRDNTGQNAASRKAPE
jgi:hypothetical protein